VLRQLDAPVAAVQEVAVVEGLQAEVAELARLIYKNWKSPQIGTRLQFGYLGLQTLYDRYFLHSGDRRIELPQHFFMRVAMGLSLNEKSATGARSSSTTCCPASTS